MNNKLTFRAIEKMMGLTQSHGSPTESLEIWYESVFDKPISDFDIEDVCRACRQELYSEYVVPVAIARLQQDPLAGEKYDGELLVALTSITRDFWVSHLDLAKTVVSIVSAVDTNAYVDLDNDIRRLLERLV
jgi:hypothetical protein